MIMYHPRIIVMGNTRRGNRRVHVPTITPENIVRAGVPAEVASNVRAIFNFPQQPLFARMVSLSKNVSFRLVDKPTACLPKGIESD